MRNGNVHLHLASPISALAVSPGIAIGPVRLYGALSHTPGKALVAKIASSEVEAEEQRLREALQVAINELQELTGRVAQTVGRSEADIFEAQQLMLEDPELLAEVHDLITSQHYSAASALQQAGEHQAQELEALESETLAARSADIRDAASRVVRLLESDRNVEARLVPGESTPMLIVAHDLTPSDTASLDPTMILGICTVVGGTTTHAAIIARALEIPAIAGIDPQLLTVLQNGQQVAIDGTRGLIYLQLDDEQGQQLRADMLQQQEERVARRTQDESLWRTQPASTADGRFVQVFANVGDLESARAAGEQGAEGIGLLRTEFLFGGRSIFPNEQEQFDSYVDLFRAFADAASLGKTIIARTLDAGADKPFPALEPLIGLLQEANPALGLRGARIHLMHNELLRQQLRALLRAGAAADVQLHIMFPMITTLEEVRRLRAIYHTVREELSDEGVMLPADTQLGIMVETPAAALMVDALAREVDFFSIGANDLYQYTMAADRTNSRVTSMFSVLEPAVWRLIAHVIQAAQAHNKMVAVCGELAADPKIGPLLAGLGVEELSMSLPSIVRVKAALHAH
ncbi:MAG: phosphoenolpyruvate--protein phosphotransferase, partial [Chloroflexi bacterium]